MEEALWSLEDKWKVSTHKATALLACTCLLLIGACAAAAALRRRRRSVHQEPAPPPALMGPVRWSKWEERDDVVWQRPILMGEKCELPRFSGLIMYDHKGMPIHHYQQQRLGHNQEMSPPVVTTTTLRELL